METSNIIALILGGIGFIISIIGLVISPILNLKSKRLEKRLEYRFHLFQKITELWELTHKNKTMDENAQVLMFDINKLIQLYGYNSEIRLFRNAIDSYNQYSTDKNDANRKDFFSKFNAFFENSFNTYRKEIVLEELE